MKFFAWIFIFVIGLGACAPKATMLTEDVTTSPDDVPIITLTHTTTPTKTATITPLTPTLTETEPFPTETERVSENVDLLAEYPDDGYGPVGFPDDINPLTGLPVEDPLLLDRRPIAVKISNYPRDIRPQWGLSQADHVFEYYHEGGLTRFHAIFYGTDVDQTGPIRSARFPDEHLVRAYKSVFAFGSADYRVRWRLYNSEFFNRLASVSDKACPPDITYPTCRIDPNQWNHLMTDTNILSQHFTEQGVSNSRQYLDGLRFDKQPPDDAEEGMSLKVRYSSDDYHKWVYEPGTGRYSRFHDAAPDIGEGETFELLVDRYNDQPVSADNVVILFANYSFFSREPEMMEIDLSGFGRAIVFRDGKAYDVNWARVNDQEIIALTYEDGERFPLRPGSTWFDIVGTSSPIAAETAEWSIQFQTP